MLCEAAASFIRIADISAGKSSANRAWFDPAAKVPYDLASHGKFPLLRSHSRVNSSPEPAFRALIRSCRRRSVTAFVTEHFGSSHSAALRGLPLRKAVLFSLAVPRLCKLVEELPLVPIGCHRGPFLVVERDHRVDHPCVVSLSGGLRWTLVD